jgi:stage II sporulation SpoAA-like protein
LIEPIADLPEGLKGFRFVGELTDDDYADVLVPALQEAAGAGEVRLVLVAEPGVDLGSLKDRFQAALSDPDLDLGHRRDWRRVALVAEAGRLVRHSFPVWSRLVPVDVKLFAPKDEAEALSWVAG